MSTCPTEEELFLLADDTERPAEARARELRTHLETCARCSAEWQSIALLTGNLAAMPAELDVESNVAAVLARIAAPRSVVRRFRRSWAGIIAAGLSAAAAVVLALRLTGGPPSSDESRFAARGRGTAKVAASSPLEGRVSLHLLRLATPAPVVVRSGDAVDTADAFVCAYRNVGSTEAHVLVFGVDARAAVHWLYPEFTDAATDPESATLGVAAEDMTMRTSVVLEAPAPGPMHVYAVVTEETHHVSEIENLPAGDLSASELVRRFPRALVDEWVVEVTAKDKEAP
jgi:hypothetical protein